MIRFIAENTGIPFIYWDTGTGQYVYGSGTMAGASTVDAALLGYGRLSGSAAGFSTTSAFWRAVAHIAGTIETFSSTTAKWRAVAKISGAINTFSTLTGGLNRMVTVEYLRIKSLITRILKIRSNGDT
jgi:hypothetical protein